MRYNREGAHSVLGTYDKYLLKGYHGGGGYTEERRNLRPPRADQIYDDFTGVIKTIAFLFLFLFLVV